MSFEVVLCWFKTALTQRGTCNKCLYLHAQYSDMAVLKELGSGLYAIFANLTFLYEN
jgi:hypothetical protein